MKPVNKGGAIVVWSHSLCIEEANGQLSDHRSTSKVSGKGGKHGQWYECQVRTITFSQTTRCYHTAYIPLLSTIHNPNLGRPIVSNCTFPTENVSSHLDEVMAHLVRSLATYVKDTNHALHIFDSFRFDTTILDNAFCSLKSLQRVLL